MKCQYVHYVNTIHVAQISEVIYCWNTAGLSLPALKHNNLAAIEAANAESDVDRILSQTYRTTLSYVTAHACAPDFLCCPQAESV